MKHKVIFLNGPIGCGKDTIGGMLADILCEKYDGANTAQFKELLYEHTANLFQVNYRVFRRWARGRITKETKREQLNGFSAREALIFTSENVYKQIFGKDYFGKALVNSLHCEVTVITDSGFYDEAKAVIDEVGAENCLLVNICRDGCSFNGDSRSYINLDDLGVKRIKLDNNHSLEYACNVIIEAFDKLNIKEHKYPNGEVQLLMDV